MSEMLGNRYFIARQFDRAIPQLEDVLRFGKNDNKIKKKLIICYIETGNFEKAFSFFCELVKIDPMIIIDTDPYYDDCPCGELIRNWESKLKMSHETYGFYEVLGMLSLYCDLSKSIHYFQKALLHTRNQTLVTSIIKKLTEFNLEHQSSVHEVR
jgi:tetratricopeptide (TPR) repeat protein